MSRHPSLFTPRTRPGMRLPAAGPVPDRPPRWRIVNQTGDAPAELWLYDAIGEDLFGFGINAEELCRDLAELSADEILLRVNSPGGDYFDGIAIYNALVQHPAHVVAQVDGMAASAASFIIQAANKVVVGRGARVMIHDAIGMCVGNAADMQDMLETLDAISEDVAGVYRAHAGGGAKAWRDRMRTETWYSAEESVAAGLADEMSPQPKRRGQEQDGRAAAAADWPVAAAWDLSVLRRPEPAAVVPPEPAGPPDAVVGVPAATGPIPVAEVPAVAVAFDRDAFRAAVALGARGQLDPAVFRESMAVAAGHAHAPDVPARPAPELPPAPAPAVAPAPVMVGPSGLDVGEFVSRLNAAATSMPAPPARAFPATPALPPMPAPAPAPPLAATAMTLAEFVRAAVDIAATSMPAPPGQAEPEPDTAHAPTIDPAAFRRALKGATL